MMKYQVILTTAFFLMLGICSCRSQDCPATLLNVADGGQMVLIPAGEFQMGDASQFNAQPVHSVYLDAFYIDVHEVTNRQWKRFVDANPQWQKSRADVRYHDGNYLKHWDGNSFPPDKADHPVVYVSWQAAAAYARWADKRLPTEAEWEKSASGPERYIYAWGNEWRPDKANVCRRIVGTTRVGSFDANAYGLRDTTGNVLEMCADWFNDAYYASSPSRNPTGPTSGPSHVLRGGSWIYCQTRCTNMFRFQLLPPMGDRTCLDSIGFRCVKSLPVQQND